MVSLKRITIFLLHQCLIAIILNNLAFWKKLKIQIYPDLAWSSLPDVLSGLQWAFDHIQFVWGGCVLTVREVVVISESDTQGLLMHAITLNTINCENPRFVVVLSRVESQGGSFIEVTPEHSLSWESSTKASDAACSGHMNARTCGHPCTHPAHTESADRWVLLLSLVLLACRQP